MRFPAQGDPRLCFVFAVVYISAIRYARGCLRLLRGFHGAFQRGPDKVRSLDTSFSTTSQMKEAIPLHRSRGSEVT